MAEGRGSVLMTLRVRLPALPLYFGRSLHGLNRDRPFRVPGAKRGDWQLDVILALRRGRSIRPGLRLVLSSAVSASRAAPYDPTSGSIARFPHNRASM